ncbi:F0F1 ATP synthase subunit gamma [Methylicorpusculum sp.]|uniref:F0F1 ATP synthase subunit gamma n=1 Tax=Methylicorpusculum sp. TaxID=2713644 RepID=UPI002717DF18|nr:F0F1 ATP synthase subunit gamma [Methylicorpusculum sp.]MDO8842913.1 F0F1 ATP synthase subunit gamma [Methylicorpusculum sp.]
MSQSRELQLHIIQMTEIRSILNSMKNLALIEIHKLARFQVVQGCAVANIENAALDFLDHYPDLKADETDVTQIYVLIGTERGFCGDFNEQLIRAIPMQANRGVIAIGSRLLSKFSEHDLNLLASIEGATVVEEVPAALNRLIAAINSLQKNYSNMALTVIYHENEFRSIRQRQIIPPFYPHLKRKPLSNTRPLLNSDPDAFFLGLIEHYLFAVLHEIFYISLMAENHLRLQHLEGAVKHVDTETFKLHRKSQIYRQEEITEEIEVILLNTESGLHEGLQDINQPVL